MRRPVLAVESDFQSAVLLGRVFRELGLLDDLEISVDCENALSRLQQVTASMPGLILLNLQMPRMDALSFLKLLKEDVVFCAIPVVVVAESNRAEDVAACYGLGAAGYLVKSDDYRVVLDKMKAVCAYWKLSRVPDAC